jgi:hypothetical protein
MLKEVPTFLSLDGGLAAGRYRDVLTGIASQG